MVGSTDSRAFAGSSLRVELMECSIENRDVAI